MTGPSQRQHARMHLYWARAGVSDRGDRLALTGAIVGRELASSKELTAIEALDVIDYLSKLDEAGELAARARVWLAEHRPPPPEPEPVLVDDAFALFDVEPAASSRPRWDL